MRLARPVRPITALLAATLPSLALAHSGNDHAVGFAQGLAHPFGGVDHVLASIAIGLLAGRLSGTALWQVPASFVATMAVGAALGMAGISLPFVEAGIAASIVVFGLLLARSRMLPRDVTVVLVSSLALFHGFAHGAEAAENLSADAYVVGLLSASSLLHFAGVSAALLAGTWLPRAQAALRVGGGMVVFAGAMTFAGIL